MAKVRLDRVRKTFGDVVVLPGIDLTIENEEFVVLVGPSGCGKSTLLRMIAGLDDMTSGTISIGDRIVNDVDARDRDIAMVFQSYALYPHKTVFENMSFALKLQGVEKAVLRRKVDEAASILGLTNLLDRYPRQLSGGQRQRVAMGRAIVRDPQVFLFDEPLSNLDAKLRVAMRTEIRSLHQRLRATSIYVTHDQVEAMTMADRIVVMNAGRIEQVGTPMELYDRPANVFVANFIGSPAINLLPGRMGQNGRFTTSGGASLPVQSAVGATPRPLLYGIRPEHLEIDHESGLPFRVEIVEPTGSQVILYGDLAGNPVYALFGDLRGVTVGDTLKLSPRSSAAHLFDEHTGTRLNS
ncbi:ABC transporter ATP-binding protein [Microvirga mediterraneensis]|uniref:sn-glycerol-3-phosphate ABC transporter ATP-binding protein UgpC n=1 Tax=Microvirga mediterraneensis TaxID=2754695 RepID=A0A838BSK4_9HYPH|nr:sn-glycerol-3-phosphate ABC transporter ATP-binding protein UgpC [Microvirga mediterraneensis]MBA1158378.1 sn-glycerol-3-phosphate ABC transporter ATP-binding protein UgpC [Microvirga mediterraneensis]